MDLQYKPPRRVLLSTEMRLQTVLCPKLDLLIGLYKKNGNLCALRSTTDLSPHNLSHKLPSPLPLLTRFFFLFLMHNPLTRANSTWITRHKTPPTALRIMIIEVLRRVAPPVKVACGSSPWVLGRLDADVGEPDVSEAVMVVDDVIPGRGSGGSTWNDTQSVLTVVWIALSHTLPSPRSSVALLIVVTLLFSERNSKWLTSLTSTYTITTHQYVPATSFSMASFILRMDVLMTPFEVAAFRLSIVTNWGDVSAKSLRRSLPCCPSRVLNHSMSTWLSLGSLGPVMLHLSRMVSRLGSR